MTSLGFVEMDPSEMKRDDVFFRSVAVSFQNAYCFQAKGYSERSEKTAGTEIGSVILLCRRLKHPLKTSQNCSTMISNASFCLSF